jgi:hypothetical protein
MGCGRFVGPEGDHNPSVDAEETTPPELKLTEDIPSLCPLMTKRRRGSWFGKTPRIP